MLYKWKNLFFYKNSFTLTVFLCTVLIFGLMTPRKMYIMVQYRYVCFEVVTEIDPAIIKKINYYIVFYLMKKSVYYFHDDTM